MKKIIGVALIIMFLFSCASKTNVPTTEKNSVSTVTKEFVSVEAGKSLYENNCAKCHKLYDPKAYTAERWTGILKWMQPKAQITDEQREEIYRYVTFNK